MTPGRTRSTRRTSRRGAFRAACLSAALLAASCAAVPPAPSPPPAPPPPEVEEPPPPPDPFRAFPDAIRQRARDAEARDDARKALFLWRVVRTFRAEDDEAADKIRSLSGRLRASAESHFREGVRHAGEGDPEAARREFLLALASDPSHAGARDYLKNRLREPDVTIVEAQEGDTPRRIAKEKYNDPDKDELIARFNDIDRNARLAPGTRLKLPVLEAVPVAPEGPEKGPRDILSYSNDNDRPAEAERLYRSGLRQFQAGALEKAAADWEKAVRLDPSHAKARRELDRVRRMLQKLK